MTKTIDGRIVKAEVVAPGEADAAPADARGNVVQMHEKLQRPEVLIGETYKIKTPMSEHALYVTINDIVLNQGTEHEMRRPFEMFINSKNMDHFQWIVALTRIISAVFRKGGDVTFMVGELRSVFDPRGGYFRKGGRFVPSLVAEIGDVLELHLRRIGILREEPDDPHRQRFLDEKRAEATQRETAADGSESGIPADAELCALCQHKAVVYLDGCLTCLNCGDSQCG
jgi:hypothetical protein